MGVSITEIAQRLQDSNKKVQMIYAFNGMGKPRLSKSFRDLVSPKRESDTEHSDLSSKQIIYYNAFTEDLFYWDNDLEHDTDFKLRIHANSFTNWVYGEQGQDQKEAGL